MTPSAGDQERATKWNKTDPISYIYRFAPLQSAAVVKLEGGGWQAMVDGARRGVVYGWSVLDGHFRTRREAMRAAERMIAALRAEAGGPGREV